MRAAALCAFLALALAAIGGTALAKTSPGVHSDPGSPASKEYAVPLNTARGGGGGGSSSGLFGSGITSSGGPSSGATSGAATVTHHRIARTHPTRHTRRRHAGPPPTTSTAAQPAKAPATSRVLHPSSGSGLAWMAGVAALVLILGGGAAALLVRRGRPDQGPQAPTARGAGELG